MDSVLLPGRDPASTSSGSAGSAPSGVPALTVPALTGKRRRPQVVAHRGASDDAPEHTLMAYQVAIEHGAEALECDVRLTSDGVLVCVHDRRVDRTSTGRGAVSVLELAELSQLDWGSWKGSWVEDGAGAVISSDGEAVDTDGYGVLTLDRLLSLIVDCGRRVELAIETKHPTRYAGLVERRLVETLHRYGLAHPRLGETTPARVMSFSTMSLRRINKLAPSIPTVLLMEHVVAFRLRDGRLPRGTRIAGPSIEIIRAYPEYVERVHRMGHEVHVWTVDKPVDVDLCVRLGVDAIITNRPGRVLRRVTGEPVAVV